MTRSSTHLDLIAAAVTAAGVELALDGVRRTVEQLGDDVEHLRLVLAVLAVEAVWMVPPASEQPFTDAQILTRQIQLQLWGRQRGGRPSKRRGPGADC